MDDLQRTVFHEIVGNPFRPVTINPAWLDHDGGLVRRLAQTIDEQRDFASLTVLGDALEDAGCTNRELLEHCRSPGPHLPGCWAVDSLLGR
jgi:hypothetical protein